jgi:hypothetical protein
MPAIDLSRLKLQAARLSEKFGDPPAYVHELLEILDYYTNRTIRSTQVAQHLSLSTYRTPKPVLRQIEKELEPLANARPAEAVTLTAALWEVASLETRLLAARLLGMIPPAQAMPGFTRLPDWLGQSSDKEIQQALLVDAMQRLRRENTEAYFILLEDWLKSNRSGTQIWGLNALVPLLSEPGFENLPAVFRILQPAIRAASPATQLDLQTCLVALSRVSITETLYFLREILGAKPSPMMLRTLRRILPALPEDLQSGLREALRGV